jgi:hypothetical protein
MWSTTSTHWPNGRINVQGPHYSEEIEYQQTFINDAFTQTIVFSNYSEAKRFRDLIRKVSNETIFSGDRNYSS